MIVFVNAENRHRFERQLREMHAQRHQVFIDTLGWPLPSAAGEERDQYDHEDLLFLLALDESHGRVQASVRLLPTDRPHPLLDLFSGLCAAEVPMGPRVREISRFCVSPAIVGRRARLRLLWEIICGSLETALACGFERLTFVANRALKPLAIGCGWDAVVLGPTLQDREDEVTAIAVSVSQSGLERVRHRFGIGGPVVDFGARTRVAA